MSDLVPLVRPITRKFFLLESKAKRLFRLRDTFRLNCAKIAIAKVTAKPDIPVIGSY